MTKLASFTASSLIHLLRLIPLPLLKSILGLACQLVGSSGRHSEIIRLQSQAALGENNPVSAKENFRCLGHSVAETIHIPKLLKHGSFDLSKETEEFLIAAKKEGALVLSAHLACFELLAAYFVSRGLDLFTVGKKPNYKFLDEFIRKVRLDYGSKTIWRDDKKAVHKLLKAFRGKATIGSLIDQDTKLDSVYSRFFFEKSASPSGLLELAIRTKKPIFSCVITRDEVEKTKFSIAVSRIHSDKSCKKEALEDCLYQYNRHIEAEILKSPNQWVWWHRRWRREAGVDYSKNPEKLRSTEEYIEWLESISTTKQS